MRIISFLLVTGITLAADTTKTTPKVPAITPEQQQAFAVAQNAFNLAKLKREAAEARLAEADAGKVLNDVIVKLQAVCPLTLDGGLPVCARAAPPQLP